MIRFRPFKNDDVPAIAKLWSTALPDVGVSRPLNAHEFDSLVMCKPFFEGAGVIVAERACEVVGFAHAGFGPEAEAPDHHHRLDYQLGTIGMLVAEPGPDDRKISDGLIAAAERYLRQKGAKVIYAGGQLPLNPFYWGIYGGSEWAGILGGHLGFHAAVQRAGFESVSTTVLLDFDLARTEIRDPKAAILRRQTQIQISEDDSVVDWWEAAALGDFRPTLYRLISKADATELARATTWDMSGFGRKLNRVILGLIHVEVPPDQRRKGHGRFLVSEILRQSKGNWTDAVSVQTRSTNLAALNLYESLGFQRVETSTLYRLPGGFEHSDEETNL